MESIEKTRPSGKKRKSAPRIAVWPIRNESDYDRAREAADKLVLVRKPTQAQANRLEVLLALMEAYEEARHPIDASHSTPVEALEFLMERNGMNASDLGRFLGNRSLGSAILRGKRQLSKTHIRKLCDRFHLSAEAFL